MSAWTYRIMWTVKRQTKFKEFTSKHEAEVFFRWLEHHGKKPVGRAFRKVTFLDRVKAFFGNGRITVKR